MNNSGFHLLHDTHMIREAILAILIIPVKEDDHSWSRHCATAELLVFGLEPKHTVSAGGELGDDACVDIAALIGAPADKAGTPFHAALKTVPGPIGFAANIAYLGRRHRNDLFIGAVDPGAWDQ